MQILSVLTRKTKTFFKISNELKVEFLKAFFYTGFYRAFILFVPFNKYYTSFMYKAENNM